MRLIDVRNIAFSGAYCHFDGRKIVISDVMLVNDDDESFSAVTGQVTLIGPGYAQVACRSGKLFIRQVQVGADEIKSPEI